MFYCLVGLFIVISFEKPDSPLFSVSFVRQREFITIIPRILGFSCLTAGTEYPTESNFRQKAMFWLTVWTDAVRRHCGKGMDVWVSEYKTVCSQLSGSGRDVYGIRLLFSFFLFHAVQASSLWMVLPNFRMSLPTPVNPVSKCPHKYTRKCAPLRPQVFPNLSKLSKSADQGPFVPPPPPPPPRR